MTLLLAAAVLIPSIYWDKPPDTAASLKQAGITEIEVPAPLLTEWRKVPGVTVRMAEPNKRRISAPAIRYQRHRATATEAPWVDGNGWRFIRDRNLSFVYEAPGQSAALAAAEAVTFRARAGLHTDEAGLKAVAPLLTWLKQQNIPELPPRVNIGFEDDGTPESGEFMNLLVRRNLLFRVVKAPDSKLDLNVKPWTDQYPRSEAGNPAMLAERVRANLTDEKRLLRIYGSEVVVGQLTGDVNQSELFLLNYAASRVPVEGLHVRVLGSYARVAVRQMGSENSGTMDLRTRREATEFTIDKLGVLAVVDLSK